MNIFMLAPAANMTFASMPSGSTYVSNQFALIVITNGSVADQLTLLNNGCYSLSANTGLVGNPSVGALTLAALYTLDVTQAFLKGTIGAVFNDTGTPANDGLWVKTGTGTGTGNWTQAAGASFTLKTPTTFGGVGNGSTDDTAAVTACEAATDLQFYLPSGLLYKTTLTYLAKQYIGPGGIQLANGTVVNGIDSQGRAISPLGHLSDINAIAATSPKSYILIGDSNFYSLVSEVESVPYLLQNALSEINGSPRPTQITTTNLQRLSSSGAVIDGTSGPLKYSRQVPPGGTLSFVSDNVDYVGFWFRRAASLGTVQLSYTDVTGSHNVGAPISTAGATADFIFSGLIPFPRLNKGATITLTAATNSVDISGVMPYHLNNSLITSAPDVLFYGAFRSGYCTTNFTDATVLADLVLLSQTVATNFPSVIISLGTNNIYNATVATTSAQYAADLHTIIAALYTSGGIVPILVCPPRPNESLGFTPVLEPFDNYRTKLYEIARQYGFDVIDFSEIDFAKIGAYQGDGVHWNIYGQQIAFGLCWSKLGLVSEIVPDVTTALTFTGGAIAGSNLFAVPNTVLKRGGSMFIRGQIDVTASTVGTVIAGVSPEAVPMNRMSFLVPCYYAASAVGWANILIDVNGQVTLYKTSAASPLLIMLDGVSWSVT